MVAVAKLKTILQYDQVEPHLDNLCLINRGSLTIDFKTQVSPLRKLAVKEIMVEQ